MIQEKKFYEAVGTRIREVRNLMKLSQSEFASKFGLDHQKTVSEIEKGNTRLPLYALVQILQGFGIRTDYLLFGSKPMLQAEVTSGEAPTAYDRAKSRGESEQILTGEYYARQLRNVLRAVDEGKVQIVSGDERASRGSESSAPVLAICPPDENPRKWLASQGLLRDEERQLVAIPILDGRVAAGAPRNVFEHEPMGFAFCWKPHVKHPASTSAVKVAGESMEPDVPDGALIGVDHSIRDPEEILRSKRRLAVVRADDDGVIVRRIRRLRDGFLFEPTNRAEEFPTVEWRKGEDNPIVGRVIFIYCVAN